MYNVSSRPYSTACVDMYKISVSPKNSSFMTCSYISRSMITFIASGITLHSTAFNSMIAKIQVHSIA